MTQFKEEGNALLTAHIANMTGNLPLATKGAHKVVIACYRYIYELNKKRQWIPQELCVYLKVSSVLLWVFRAGEVLQKEARGQSCLYRETQLVAILNSKAEASQQEHICSVYLNTRHTGSPFFSWDMM